MKSTHLQFGYFPIPNSEEKCQRGFLLSSLLMGKTVRQNIIGPVVRKLRYQQGLTQAMLSARCARAGWDIGDNTVAKIEAQIRCVTDQELVFLAKALRVQVQEIFPA